MSYDNFTSANDTCLNEPGLSDLCPAPAYLTFVTALQLALLKNDKIAGFSERIRPTEKPDDVYDFVVVGGGAAGSIVASRLSENPEWKVLLLEAGGDEPAAIQVPSFFMMSELESDVNWNYKTQNETNACLSNNGSCTWSAGKMLGGCTAHNTMIYLRGNPTDYNKWAKLGNEGWTWDEVKPYFLKVEDNKEIDRVGREYHSTGGPMSVERLPYVPPFSKVILEAATQLGYNLTEDSNGEQITGFGITQTTSKDGVRHSSAAAYLRPARNRKNLHVSLNSSGTKVIIENDTAVGVQYIKDSELRTVRVTREVILSAGTKRSPHLLLLSGIGPREHLESAGVEVIKNLPGVGENLHEHVASVIRFTINEPDIYDNNWAAAEQYLYNQTGPLASIGLGSILGLIASNNTTPDHPDVQFHFLGYNPSCAPGRITLASKIPLEYPYIWSNRFGDPSDLDGMFESIERALKFAETPALKAWNFTLAAKPLDACSRYTFLSSDYWKCAVKQSNAYCNSNTYHDVGTCKMGPKSDPMAVVDPKLRVHGIRRLRVADASIMPQVPSGNTAAPTMMIGERVADFIKAEHSCN